MLRPILLISIPALFASASVLSQEAERGPTDAFGSDGRLFSSGSSDYYLLTKQSFSETEISGFQGQLRIKKKYRYGGFEELRKEYRSVCHTEHEPVVVVYNPSEEPATEQYVLIVTPNVLPGFGKKYAYNLYWATCYNRFLRFK